MYCVSVNIGNVNRFDSGTVQDIEAVGDSIDVAEHNPDDSGLNDQLGTFHARRRCDVERRTRRRVVASRYFRYGIGLGVEYIGLRDAVGVFADVLKSGGSAVETVGDYHLVAHKKRTDTATGTIGVFRPD